jgi:Ca2+-binding EF-hand superfamily protein
MKVWLFIASSFLVVTTAMADDAFDAIDVDHTGTISEKEALNAGRKIFQLADKNSDGRLDQTELRERLARQVVKTADPDADGALNPEEYSALVKARLKSANANGDGEVSRDEFQTLAGKLFRAIASEEMKP